MPKLTDTQMILLSHAAQAENGSFYPLPAALARGGKKVADALQRFIMLGFSEERTAKAGGSIHREEGDLRFGLFVTPAGLAAIGVEPAPASHWILDGAKEAGEGAGPRQTKAALVWGLLQREHGATLADLIEATGWLPHTMRAALTGLRKKGHAIEKSKRDEVTCYRVMAA